MLLLMMMLTTASAWATDITVTYKISVSGGTLSKPVATITNAATGTTVCTWDNGYKTLWPANETHVLGDNYGITLTPDRDLDKTGKNENGKNASTTAFKTEGNTTFTVNVRNSQYYLKSVTFKEDDKVKASLEVAPNNRSGNVTIEGEKFFNYITVELTTNRYYSLTPSGSISINTTPARTYNDTYYYTAGTNINVTPTNASCIVEGVSGVDNATIANDKRRFSFTMPAKDVSLSASLAEVHTISGVPNEVSISDPYTTINGTNFYLSGQAYTLTAPTYKAFSSFTATGAANCTLTSSRNIATVTIGTADVTVNAELLVNAGTCGENATWRVSDENNDGTFETLHIEGTGDMANYAESILTGTITPWNMEEYNRTITTVNIADGITSIGNACFAGLNFLTEITLPSSVSSIGAFAFQNCLMLTRINIQKTDGVVYLTYYGAFNNCSALSTIVVPTPALALQYATASNWTTLASKLRTEFGGQIFGVTNEGGTAAYKIATAADLRNLAAAVKAAANISSGKTFRQTADIDLNDGQGNFTPIGFRGGNWSFKGIYDGGSHTISGLTVSGEYDNAGLFGWVNHGTVKNVILVSPSVTSTYSSTLSICVGALVGYSEYATIENCHAVSPTVSATGSGSGEKFIGALIGELNSGSSVTNCYYYRGNQSNAIGGGIGLYGITITRLSAAHLVNPATGVTIQTEMAADLGFSCDSDDDGTPENYWREGAELTLASDLTTDEQGYTIGFTTTAGTINDQTLTVGDDATVSTTLVAIDWAKESSGNDANHPYMIYNKDQLLLLAYRVNGTHGETRQTDGYKYKYFKLGADIEFDPDDLTLDNGQSNYEAIGDGTNNFDFQGDFDGADFTVSGIRIRKTGSDTTDKYQGLFGEIYNANVHNVHLTDARIYGYYHIGGIVGYNMGTVSNCTVTESDITITNGSKNYYGIICATNVGTLSHNYYRHCTVNGNAVTSGKGCQGKDVTANDGAVPMYVAYIDADGNQQRCIDYTEVTSDMTADKSGKINWESGTYVVKSDVTLSGCIRFIGEVINLIVCDGKTLTVNGSKGAFDGSTLNIYAQSTGTGAVNVKKYTSCNHLNIAGGMVTLDADGDSYGLYINSADGSGLTVNGGDVTILNNNGSLGAICFDSSGFVTLNGGKLTVTNNAGNSYNAIEGAYSNTINFNGGTAEINGRIVVFQNINLNGGNVTVNGEIYEKAGYTVTYDFTHVTDSYYIQSFSDNLYSEDDRTITIADGKAFYNGSEVLSGTVTDMDKLNGKTLIGVDVLEDASNNDVAALATSLNGKQTNIALNGRTLWKDGAWNTLCLPFDVEIKESVLDGADVRELADANLTDEVLTLNFSKEGEVSTIEAGKPYIIKWEKGENLVSPVFKGVTVKSGLTDFESSDGKVNFKGTYAPLSWTEETPSILFVGAKNTLNWPLDGAHLNAFRAYFELDPNAHAREFVMNFDGGSEETGIDSMHNSECLMLNRADAWYTVNGVKLDGRPTAKGMYIRNGKKVVIK